MEEENIQPTQDSNTENQEVESTVENNDNTVENTENQEDLVAKARKEARTETLRELSKTLGHNLFSDEDIKNFKESLSQKVDKEEYESATSKLKEYEEIAKERDVLRVDNALLKENINPEYTDKVKKLINVEMQSNENANVEDVVKSIVEDFPIFVSKAQKAGMYMGNENQTKTGYEKELEKYKGNPYFKGKN